MSRERHARSSADILGRRHAGADGSHRIWTVSLADDAEAQVSHGPGDEFWPSWAPDGSRIAFVRTESVGHLVVVDAAGREETQLEPAVLGGVPNVWSPDGTRLLSFTWGDLAPIILDPTNAVPPTTLPATSSWQTGSWQRLAP
ncbi:MAG: hypothetical protein U0667_08070 [Chloroflexota bacterium]